MDSVSDTSTAFSIFICLGLEGLLEKIEIHLVQLQTDLILLSYCWMDIESFNCGFL